MGGASAAKWELEVEVLLLLVELGAAEVAGSCSVHEVII